MGLFGKYVIILLSLKFKNKKPSTTVLFDSFTELFLKSFHTFTLNVRVWLQNVSRLERANRTNVGRDS